MMTAACIFNYNPYFPKIDIIVESMSMNFKDVFMQVSTKSMVLDFAGGGF